MTAWQQWIRIQQGMMRTSDSVFPTKANFEKHVTWHSTSERSRSLNGLVCGGFSQMKLVSRLSGFEYIRPSPLLSPGWGA